MRMKKETKIADTHSSERLLLVIHLKPILKTEQIRACTHLPRPHEQFEEIKAFVKQTPEALAGPRSHREERS